MKRLAFLVGCLAGLLGCGGPAGTCPDAGAVTVAFDPELPRAEGWLAYPFPSDHRRNADGTIDLGDFPNPGETNIVEEYLIAAESLDGFSNNAPAYFSFDGALAVDGLPAKPEDYVDAEAPLQVIDLARGERWPVRSEWRTQGDGWAPENTLAIAPAWGLPLRSGDTYAFLVRRDLGDASGDDLAAPPLLTELLGGKTCAVAPNPASRSTLETVFRPLAEFLEGDALAPEDLAAATVFTARDVLAPLNKIYDQLMAGAAPAQQEADWQLLEDPKYYKTRTYEWQAGKTVTYWVMEGRYETPNYQEGTVPYQTGGGFHFVNGEPEPVRTEQQRFVLTLPQSPPTGESCYPLVLYSHGTGGSAYGFSYSTAGRLAARGIAGMGIDQPLAGPRGQGKSFDINLMSFNLLNPDGGTTLFRQAAVDIMVQARFAKESLIVPASKSPTGTELCFRSDRVGFFGHSQGGLAGGLAAAYDLGLEPQVLSGAGGGLSITVMERKDPVDLSEAMLLLGGFDGSEAPLTEYHPLITLVQTLADITDPVNYAPRWQGSILMTSGQWDADTPWRTASALAFAGDVPIVAPLGLPATGGLPFQEIVDPTVMSNVDGATRGLLQSREGDHFVIFDDPVFINSSMRFLGTGLVGGQAVIERNPGATDQ